MADRVTASFIDVIYRPRAGAYVSHQAREMGENSAEVVCKPDISGMWDRIDWIRSWRTPSPRKGEADD